jgi:predicted O-methyltransferase YrrM
VTLITDQIAKTDVNYKPHVAGAFATSVLRRLEELMPKDIKHSVETGCGKSTILFSNLSQDHTVFCLDDREHGENSSITYFQSCELTKNDRITMELGPTQKTLPFYQGFKPYDVVLIDGPHGYPFPEIEYYHFYPHLRTGGLLIVDDVHIASIGRMADVIAEDAMFETVELVSTTAVFRRTDAPTFNPTGDGWWEQQFNRRRIPRNVPYLAQYVLDDKKELPSFSSKFESNMPPSVQAAEGFLRSTAAKLLKR